MRTPLSVLFVSWGAEHMDSVRTMKLCGFPVREWRPLGATMILTCTFRAACLDEKLTCMLTSQIRNWCQPLFHVGDDFQNNSNAYHSRSMMEYDVHYGCSERQSDIPATHKEAADTYVPHTGQVREVYQPRIYIYSAWGVSATDIYIYSAWGVSATDIYIYIVREVYQPRIYIYIYSAWGVSATDIYIYSAWGVSASSILALLPVKTSSFMRAMKGSPAFAFTCRPDLSCLVGSAPRWRMCRWWILCTFYLLACHMRPAVGHWGLCCCVHVTSLERWLSPLFADSA